MKTFDEYIQMEGSRWRTDTNLRKIINKDAANRGDMSSIFDKTPRINALQQGKEILGGGKELPGFRSWLDKLHYRQSPDSDTHQKISQGKQPTNLYRGARSYEALKGGFYSNDRNNPIVHGAPFANSAASYSGGKPDDVSRERSGVHATELPKEFGNPKILAKFQSRPDQRYTGDPGLELGQKGHTPDEVLNSGGELPSINGGSETNLIKNKFKDYVLMRNRGVDRSGRRKPTMATISKDQMDKVLLPNLKMI